MRVAQNRSWLGVFVGASLLMQASCEDSGTLHLDSLAPQAGSGALDGGSSSPAPDDDDDGHMEEKERELIERLAVRVRTEESGDCEEISCGPGEVCLNLDPEPDGSCGYGTHQDSDCCFPAESPLDEDDLVAEFLSLCRGPFSCPYISSNDCDAERCAAFESLCTANYLLDAAGLRSEALSYELGFTNPSFPPGTRRSVPPQSSASQVTLAVAAFHKAFDALQIAKDGIAEVVTDATSNPALGCAPATAGQMSALFVDAYYVANEAIDIAVQRNIAIADSNFSSSSSQRERTDFAMLGSVLSRSAAAHLLVGGANGLPTTPSLSSQLFAWAGMTQFALCNQPPLTPQGQTALKTIREAAINPAHILDSSMDISLLVDGRTAPTGSPPYTGGSVRQRLQEIWNSSELDQANSIADTLGLRMGDFAEAREYLKQEIATFQRSTTARLAARPLAGGVPNNYVRYATTATEAPQRDPMYWVTVAQHQDYGTTSAPLFANRSDFYTWGGLYPAARPGGIRQFGLAGAVDIAVGGALQLVAQIQGSTALNTTLKGALIDPLLLFLADGQKVFRGRLRFIQSSSTSRSFQADCFTQTAGLLLLNGEDGLACATQGHIEEAACTVTDYITARFDQGTSTSPGEREGCTVAAGTSNLATYPAKGTRLYVVEPLEPGRTGPGDYRALASFVSPGPGLASPQYRNVPMVPQLYERVARILAPSRKWCSRPEISCAGESFDARLPLEDELSEDNDSVESSWRHYLTLARQAADEADLLGDRVVDLSLEQLQREEEKQLRQISRAEGAIEELQDVCGVTVDPTELLREFSSDGTKDFNGLRGKQCAVAADCTGYGSCWGGRCTLTCTADSQCVLADGKTRTCVRSSSGGVCTLDPFAFVTSQLTNPALVAGRDISNGERLKACLGDDQFVRHATTGNKNLCLWYQTTNPNNICSGVGASQCPFRAINQESTDPAVACAGVTAPTGNTMAVVSSRLNYFDLDANTGGFITPELCNDIRRLRATRLGGKEWQGRGLLERIKATNFFDPDALEMISRKISWQASPNGYSFIKVGERVTYGTGYAEYGPYTGAWPCNAAARPTLTAGACPGSTGGLFCDYGDCTDPAQRARLNKRMRDAVIAARDMTIVDPAAAMAGVYLPFYVRYDAGSRGLAHHNTLIEPFKHTYAPVGAPAGSVTWKNIGPLGHHDTWAWMYDCTTCGMSAWSNRPAPDVWDYPFNYFFNHGSEQELMMFSVGPVGTLTRGGYKAEWDTCNPSGLLTTLPSGFSSGSIGGALVCATRPYVKGLSELQTYDPGAWFAGLTTNPRYDGRIPNDTFRDAPFQHWGYLYNALNGPQGAISGGLLAKGNPDLDAWEELVWSPFTDCFSDSCPNHDGAPVTSKVDLMGMYPSWVNGQMYIYTRTADTMLDGLELMCQTALDSGTSCDDFGPGGPVINPADPHDLRFAEAYLECFAKDIRTKAAHAILVNVPSRALDALREQSAVGSYPQVGGELGAAISELRASLVELAGASPLLADALSQLSHDMTTLRNSLEIEEIRTQLREVQFMATVSNQLAACAAAAAPTMTGPIPSFNTGAVATCANSVAQIHFASEIQSGEDSIAQLTTGQSLNDFRREFENRTREFEGYATRIGEAGERLDAALARIEVLRNKGKRALAKAMFMDSDVVEAQTKLDIASQLRLNTARVRYERAEKNARHMAFFARRAIEQRLGVNLGEMDESLPLVDAPKTWVDRICETSGFNFANDPKIGLHYADQYIGDYVDRLELVVESYRQVYNFHEGSDTAVISLRDDVKNARQLCSMPVDNMLYQAGQLDTYTHGDSALPGWQVTGCGVDPNTQETLADCVTAVRLSGAPVAGTMPNPDDPIPGDRPGISDVSGYRVRFGPPTGACATATCGFRSASVLKQTVSVEAGRYRLSWYGRTGGTNSPATSVRLQLNGSTTWTTPTVTTVPEGTWTRYFTDIVATQRQQITVGIVPNSVSGSSYAAQSVDLAAFMLEDITSEASAQPKYFANTSFLLEQDVPLCEDTDGTVFRKQFWTKGCLSLCDNGFASVCAESSSQLHCYRELSFSLNPRDIDAGNSLTVSGFARGNFNYRIDSLGINLVGTGTRNCEDSQTPSSCYGGGFIPFSMEHLGPFRVRNYAGEDQRVELFPGIIEHARGLAAERYLTNPMSSADRELITPFYRSELRGRPLDGYFTLRIWEEPGVAFDEIEDVQLILNYRYWTRFN